MTTNDLAPCPFTLVTSIGHMERATSYTQKPLQFNFQVKFGDPSASLILRFVVTDATNYDILVCLQTLYPLGFGLENYFEEAWCRAPLHMKCPKYHLHKGDPGVVPGTCGAVGERAQVIPV